MDGFELDETAKQSSPIQTHPMAAKYSSTAVPALTRAILYSLHKDLRPFI